MSNALCLLPTSHVRLQTEAIPTLHRKSSLSASTSGEIDPEIDTPATSNAELPQPLIPGVDRLSLDDPPATPLAAEPPSELDDLPTPKHRTTFNKPSSIRSRYTPSLRMFKGAMAAVGKAGKAPSVRER